MTAVLDELTVRVVDTVDGVSAEDWRAVSTGRGFYSSPRWLRFLEADPSYDVWYLVASRHGQVLGVLPVYLSATGAVAGVDTFYDPAAVFVTPSGVGDPARWRPVLLAGGRAGYDTEVLMRPDLPAATRQQLVAAMVARLARLGAVWGVGASAFMYLTPGSAAELAPVVGALPLLTDLTAAVNLDGCDSFDDYLDRLSGHRRRRIGHEMRQFAASGLTVRSARLADVVGVTAPLMAAHHGRYGLGGTTREMLAAHLSQQAEHLGDLGQVLLCEDGGHAVGALLVYEWDRAWYARAVGLADGLRGQSAVYFNLVYYVPIRWAVQRGVRRYVVGPSTLGAKVKRGADLEPRWSVLIGTGDLAADVRTLSLHWNDRQRSRWEAELREIGHELPAAARA